MRGSQSRASWTAPLESDFGNREGLLTQNTPRQRYAQVKLDEPGSLRQPALRREREETDDGLDDMETADLQGLRQAVLIEWGDVIEEHPEIARAVADVRL